MKVIRGRTFEFDDRGGRRLRGLSVQDCVFDNCSISLTSSARRGSWLLDSELLRCRNFNSQIGPCGLIDVVVEDLRTNDLLILPAPLFRHVTLRGAISCSSLPTARNSCATAWMTCARPASASRGLAMTPTTFLPSVLGDAHADSASAVDR